MVCGLVGEIMIVTSDIMKVLYMWAEVWGYIRGVCECLGLMWCNCINVAIMR